MEFTDVWDSLLSWLQGLTGDLEACQNILEAINKGSAWKAFVGIWVRLLSAGFFVGGRCAVPSLV